ncbi:shoot gravitropism 2 (SGR2) [Artemisia annua]|uniref:Shoot gravitropism 2 (SGR2) n=1 Tax=Artemisia annua TaxID=35608 RepID=A0A2U1MA75_ARTAN|nr:shoot gravitropism 2 (SGR2) [Artemisia annua]
MAESSGKGEEGRRTAADMLRNTPSNIRRLIDEIQHYEGRQKYLAQTRSPSDGGDVRWYFSKVPMAENELAAALPLTEVVGKGDYFRFGMRDSLAIEASFLQREEELLSNWWREYGECSIGPKGSLPSISESDPMSYDLATTRNKLYSDEEERVGVPVKGGLYEVPVRHLVFMVHGIGQRLQKANLVDDVGTFRQLTQNLADKHLTSYQRETQRVLFIPCQLILTLFHLTCYVYSHLVTSSFDQSILYEQFDLWRKDLKLSGESAVEKCTLPGVRGLRVTLSATVHDVLYYMSPIYCQDIIDSVSNQLNRLYLKFLKRNPGYDGKVSLYGHSLGSVLSFDILCHQDTLASPFPMEWMYKDHNNEISPERDSFNYMENDSVTNKVGMDTLASTSDRNLSAATEIEKQDSPDLDEVGVKSVDSPIDMHSEKISSLDECSGVNSEVVMSNLNEIEEETVKNDESTNIDEETDKNDENLVIKSLKEEIDSLNAKIKELESQRAEENKQEASVTRNGSVSESSLSSKNESMKSYTPVIKYTKLMFKVDTFFAVGSPLGVFLALRNVRIGIGKGKDYWEDENIIEEMPCCRQMFNIFHPYDPVAYRVEPLVCKEYLDKRAVIIPYHRGGKRLHVGYREFVEKVESHSQVVVDQMSVAKVKVLTLCQSWESDDHEESSEEYEEIERSYGLLMLERLTGSQDGRVDHVLQNKTFEHQYISAVGAHTKYWRDPDTALFILKHLYRDIPNAPYIPNKDSENATNQENHDWKELFDDEELPLTFASEDFLKQFSVGVKKFTNK